VYDICAIGELLIDFTPSGKNSAGMECFARNAGGAPANVLAMFSKLGGKSAFIGKTGDDAFGHFLKETLDKNDIDTAGLLMDRKANTTLAFVHLDSSGERSFSFYRKGCADLMLCPQEVNLQLIDSADIFHFGSVSLTGQPCRDAVFHALDYAHARGKIISYDPNYRPLLWESAEQAKDIMARPVAQVDILKVSFEEMNLLTGETIVERGARALAKNGPAIVLVSLGRDGAFWLCAENSARLPAYDVATIDTTGAGDAFLGAVLFRLRGKGREELRCITNEEMYDIVSFANAAGSLTTTKKGAIPAMPDYNEIEKCRKGTALLL